jgi:CheY-like chemotaxis protein
MMSSPRAAPSSSPSSSDNRVVTVLVVDDNKVDREAVRRAFAKLDIANPIVEASDGVEALEKLRGMRELPPLARPFLILLDINMPRMSGIDFLKDLRADPTLSDSIVFMLTTSKNDEDRVASYGFNVAGYIIKNDVGVGFMRLVEMLEHYWRIVIFP